MVLATTLGARFVACADRGRHPPAHVYLPLVPIARCSSPAAMAASPALSGSVLTKLIPPGASELNCWITPPMTANGLNIYLWGMVAVLARLQGLSAGLSGAYLWQRADATVFILTGLIPIIDPIVTTKRCRIDLILWALRLPHSLGLSLRLIL